MGGRILGVARARAEVGKAGLPFFEGRDHANTCKQSQKQCSGTRAHHWACKDAFLSGKFVYIGTKIILIHICTICTCPGGQEWMD